jgi:heme-degrading monooxygenase HmoA
VSDHGDNPVRVLVFHRAPADEGPAGIEKAYHVISEALNGTPGLLGNELLRSPIDPDAFLVMSRWKNLDAFKVWEEGADHRGTTSPLRAYQDRTRERHWELYSVVASY